MKREVIIDGTSFQTLDGFHEALKEGLAMPGYNGANMHDLWDCLSAYKEMQVIVIWVDFATSKMVLDQDAEDALRFLIAAESQVPGFKVIVD